MTRNRRPLPIARVAVRVGNLRRQSGIGVAGHLLGIVMDSSLAGVDEVATTSS
jgi:hypothetical protein